MRLTQKKIPLLFLLSILFLFTSSNANCFNAKLDAKKKDADSSYLFSNTQKNTEFSISQDQDLVQKKDKDSASIFMELAFSYAESNKPELACVFIEKYIKTSLDVDFVSHSYFKQISASTPYKKLIDKYLKKFDWWGVFCFYVAFVGFFISIVLNFRKRADKVANFLMSAFVLIHSFFIIHIGVYLINYQYDFPHIYYASTIFSYVYGPLMYFYIKRVTVQYSFKKMDLLHLLPTVLLSFLLVPIYMMTGEEKLRIGLEGEREYLFMIMTGKLISLLIYGVLVIILHIRYGKKHTIGSKAIHYWQRNIVIFCSIYIMSYAIYTVLIMQHVFSGFLFYVQITSMSMLVLYVSYSAFVQPSLFEKRKVIPIGIKSKSSKYEKSGLTQSFSLELKIKLLHLLDVEKVYKQNDITLQKLSKLLDTNRHNTSQIINEHFELNFFELINKYRIEEAKEILKGDKYKSFNIIDVAYEVGFNNKVTFNKSFKKYNQITPTEYLKLFVA